MGYISSNWQWKTYPICRDLNRLLVTKLCIPNFSNEDGWKMVNFPGCMGVLGRPIFQRPSRFRPTYGSPRPHTGSIGALKAKAAENFPPQKTGAMVGDFHFKMVNVGFIWHHFQVYDLMLVHDINIFFKLSCHLQGDKNHGNTFNFTYELHPLCLFFLWRSGAVKYLKLWLFTEDIQHQFVVFRLLLGKLFVTVCAFPLAESILLSINDSPGIFGDKPRKVAKEVIWHRWGVRIIMIYWKTVFFHNPFWRIWVSNVGSLFFFKFWGGENSESIERPPSMLKQLI